MKPLSRLMYALLPRLSAGTLPVWLARRMHAHIKNDEELARAYDALRCIEKGSSELSAGQRDLVEAFVLDSVGAAPSHARAPVVALSAAAAASLVFAFFVIPSNELPIGDLEARGRALSQEPLGMKIACLSGDTEPRLLDSATAGGRQTLDRLHCPTGSLLAFSTTNLAPNDRYMFVVGIARNGSLRWYAPFLRESSSTRVPAGAIDAVLSTLADTRGMHDPAALHVLISDEPFDASSVERQLERALRRGTPLASVDRLPLSNVPLQARIDLVP